MRTQIDNIRENAIQLVSAKRHTQQMRVLVASDTAALEGSKAQLAEAEAGEAHLLQVISDSADAAAGIERADPTQDDSSY